MSGIIMQLNPSWPWSYVSAADCRLTAEMYLHSIPFGRYGETVRDLMLAWF